MPPSALGSNLIGQLCVIRLTCVSALTSSAWCVGKWMIASLMSVTSDLGEKKNLIVDRKVSVQTNVNQVKYIF